MVKITRIRFEYLESPAIGIGESQPWVSWSFKGDDQDWIQQRYEIEVSKSTGEAERYTVDSSSSLFVPWPGKALTSGEQVDIRIRAFGNNEVWTEWSGAASVEAGLLSLQDWKVKLVEPGDPYVARPPHRPVMFRRELTVDADLQKARLYITAHGVYEVLVNDESTGQEVLNPGWTSYQHHLTYYTLPVNLKRGVNTLDVLVAEGWYCGRLGYGGGKSNIYGDTIGLIAILVLDFESGDRHSIGTDETWRWAYGPIISSSIYDGEYYDCNQAISGSANSSTKWNAVKSRLATDDLVSPIGPPVRRVKEIPPKSIIESLTGKTIVDFGQNFVGRVRLTVPPPRREISIHLRHAEVLEKGEIVTRTLRIAKAEDILILTANKSIAWEPFFTFHGFRYVEIQGYRSASLDAAKIQGIVLQTDMKQTGQFSCSNEQLNKLHKNVEWSMRGNFLTIPTDCPQRDERLGWTGDINVFVNTANFLFDATGMLSSWLKDLALEQLDANGIVPLVVPKVREDHAQDAHPVWGDAAIMVPWSIYQST
jgi:alpha-L-rhamnosidase